MLKIGVFGISGVGKSTLIQSASQSTPLLPLGASDLIKARLTQYSPNNQARRRNSEQGPFLIINA